MERASPNTVHCIVRHIHHSLLNSCLFFSCHLLEIMKRAPPSTSSQAWQRGIIWAAALVPGLRAGRGLLVRGWQYSFGGHSGGVASDMANTHTSSPTRAWLQPQCFSSLLLPLLSTRTRNKEQILHYITTYILWNVAIFKMRVTINLNTEKVVPYKTACT